MTVIVVPCYNEAHRLDVNAFRNVPASVSCLFVDDGSTDETRKIVEGLCEGGPHRLLHIPRYMERPKRSEPVCWKPSTRVRPASDYWDADLATPLDEIPRFIDVLAQNPNTDLVLGRRINLLGRDIRRSNVRHYLGRIFATALRPFSRCPSTTRNAGQNCSASPTSCAPSWPNRSRVAGFSMSSFSRVGSHSRPGEVSRAEQVYELPLQIWHDVGGSKIRPSDVLRAPYELLRIHARYFGST